MGIEPGEHALDRAFDELLVGDGFDIVAAHLVEHLGEEVDRDLAAIGRGRDRAGERSEGDKSDRGRDFQHSHRVTRQVFAAQIGTAKACCPLT